MKEEMQQKQVAAQLDETSKRLQTILQAIPDNIYIIDSDGYIIDFDEKESISDNSDALTGRNLKQVFGEENEELFMFHIKGALVDNESKILDYQRVYGNKLHSFEVRISKISNHSVIVIVRNIDNVQRFEKHFLQINKLLQMFSHFSTQFINTPLDEFDLDAELNKALAQIGISTGVDKACIFDYEQLKNTLKRTNEWAAVGEEFLDQENPLEFDTIELSEYIDTLRKQKVIFVKNIQNELDHNSPLYKIMFRQNVVSFLTIPLMKKETLVGLIILTASKSKIEFTESIVSLLNLFAEIIITLKSKKKTDKILKESQNTLKDRNDQLLLLNNQLKKQNEEILVKNAALDSERKRAEESDRLKTAFLNNVSHEIRTPLNGIVGFSQLLANADSTEDRTDYTEALYSSVERLTNTVNDIMDVSLLMSGSMPINIETVHLAELFENVYEHHKKMAEAKGIELKLTIPENAKDFAFDTDKGFIKKMISEIVENSIKYTKEGYVRFGFEIEDKKVCIYSKDTGVGIPEDMLPRINEAFMQADHSTTRQVEGTGLGLTIVSGIVDLLKGSVKIETKVGEGTSYKIFTPINAAMEINNTQESPIKTAQVSTTNENWPTVLLAEDEDLNVLYAKRIFKSKNFNVLYARNGKEAVETVTANPDIKVILMDVKMPLMDGLEATKIIKEMNPNIIIIAVTAYAANDDRIRCLNAGCDDYMPKPFRPVDLFGMLRKWLPEYNIE